MFDQFRERDRERDRKRERESCIRSVAVLCLFANYTAVRECCFEHKRWRRTLLSHVCVCCVYAFVRVCTRAWPCVCALNTDTLLTSFFWRSHSWAMSQLICSALYAPAHTNTRTYRHSHSRVTYYILSSTRAWQREHTCIYTDA